MNRKIARIAIGYMMILVHEKGVTLQPCKLTDNNLTANCVVVDKIPSNLNAKLQKLQIKGKFLIEMNEESFKPYPNLLLLRCEGLLVKKPIADKFMFRPLASLKEVHFYKVDLTKASTFYWPESIEILNLTECLAKSLDLTNVVKLKILRASDNSLNDLPTINPLAPIESVNVNFNPLSAVTVASLARLCHVTIIDMFPTSSSTLKTQSAYCTCTAILLWMNKFNITSNIRNGETQLVCTTPFSKKTVCENQIPKEALNLREKCLKKRTPFPKWIIMAIIAAIALLLLALLFFAYMYGRLRKKEEMGEVVEIHHGKNPVAEEIVTEEEPPTGGDGRN